MRIRSSEIPPSKEDIDRIVRDGASLEDREHRPRLLRRLKQAFFLNENYQPLSARKRLIEQYRNDGLVLFLGAGVSVGSGIPSWSHLADTLLLKSGVATHELEAVKKALPSYVIQFELAAQLLGDRRALVRELYQGLYDGMACKPRLEAIPLTYEAQETWDGWDDVHGVLRTNKTLEAVGDLLITETATGPKRNPQIHAVVTFNADNLLEVYCAARAHGKPVVRMVDRASVGEHPDQTPIYHLHGALDARGEKAVEQVLASSASVDLQELSDELLPDLVFSESEYYETIGDPLGFINHTPLSFLRKVNALFIGTSLDDLNMRRWLHNSFRERVLHRTKYLREFHKKPYPAATYEATLESRRHFWVRPETERDGTGRWVVPKKHVEAVLHNLGVQVVWCTDYDDLQQCIREVRQDGCDPEFGRRVPGHLH